MKRNLSLLSLAFAAAITTGTWLGSEVPLPAETAPAQPSTMVSAVYEPSDNVQFETVAHRRHYSKRYYTHRRSKKKSAAIVGGSALGGAAIGALAGGGKGAAIGALVGGGGGYIYDRKTHKKTYRRY